MISFIICKKWDSKELQASLWVAVALEIDQVIYLLEGWQFDPWLL